MWHHLPRELKRNHIGRPLPRRDRRFRPSSSPLEERCLMAVSLTAGGPAVPLVGSPVLWTAAASGHGSAPIYQFSVAANGGAAQVVRDFTPTNSFTYDPLQEGRYDIQVIVKDGFANATGESASASATPQSRVAGTTAVVNATSNPLVALYSVPPIAGNTTYVQFREVSSNPNSPWSDTAPLTVVPGQSTNFLVASLLPSTTYEMRHISDDGMASTPLRFTSGALPTNLKFPTFTVPQPPGPGADLSQNLNVNFGVLSPVNTVQISATDRSGLLNWYYNDPTARNYGTEGLSLVPGGSVLVLGGNLNSVGDGTVLREINLAGDTLHETNVNALNTQLTALGKRTITDINHDAQRLPNGDTSLIAHTEKTVNLNGQPTQYLGDSILVLDQNFQVVWTWDSFDWLDTNRLPTLGEGAGDWLHANSVDFSPVDGNLIMSLRHQDWVIKIDYDNGAGDGHVVWRLGKGGDFTIISSDPSPWFSHQHSARYVNDSTLVLFDNGNVRRVGDSTAHSRGQELVLDEKNMTATLVVNADLGNYSQAVGAAQRLPNGNLAFDSGFLGTPPNQFGQTIEVRPDGTKVYVQQVSGFDYRASLVGSLYGTATDLLDPGFEDLIQGAGFGAYRYNPTGSVWNFVSAAGLTGNGSAFTASNPAAPQGSQVAFLQYNGSINQVVQFAAAGTYQVSAGLAIRGNYGARDEQVKVLIDGAVVTTFAPTSTGFVTFTTAPFHVTAGNHTVSFVGNNPSGGDSTAFLDQISITNAAPTRTVVPGAVDLSSSFNRVGIVADGTTFAANSGLDGIGFALSANLLGTGLVANGTTFNFGTTGANNVVSASGQTIALPTTNAATLQLLATAVKGNQTNQSFVVTYTDGSQTTFIRSLSDWYTPQSYTGESVAAATAYRNTSSGRRDARTFNLYTYTLRLDPSKQVRSLTLPNNSNVEVFAINLKS